MEEEMESSAGASMLPIALAILAIALGGAGLYFGMNASQQLSPLTDSVDAGTSSAARLEKQLSTIETRLMELAASSDQLEKTVERLRIYGSQSEQSVKQVASAAQSNRQEIVALAEKMRELADSLDSANRPVPVAPARAAASGGGGSSTGGAGSASASSGSGGGGTAGSYRIQAGDTFAKIATEKGISLNALLDANPDVDTRRLQIGQVIQLP
jgi:LysM repeat protein